MIAQIWKKLNGTGMIASFLRGASTVFIIQVFGSALGYLSQVCLARWMGVSNFGLYTYVMTWVITSTTLVELGLRDAVVKFIPEYRQRQDQARLVGVIRSSWVIVASIGGLLAVLGSLVVLYLNSQKPLENRDAILVGLWILPLFSLNELGTGTMQAFRKMVLAYLPTRLLRPLLLIVLGALFMSLHPGDSQLSAVVVLRIAFGIYMGTSLLQFFLVRDYFFGIPQLRRNPDSSEPMATSEAVPAIYDVRGLMRLALPLLMASMCLTVLHQSDIIMVGAFIGTDQAGLYNAAARTAALIGFVLSAVVSTSAPIIVSVYAENDRKKLERLMVKVSQILFYPSLGLTLFVVIFSKPILGLFGQEFVTMRWVLITLALTQLIKASAGSLGTLMQVTGYEMQFARIRATSATLNIVLNLIGVYTVGVLGVAIATATSTLFERAWVTLVVMKHFHINASILSIFTSRR